MINFDEDLMKKFVSMVLCLSIVTATPAFSMNGAQDGELNRIGMKSIRSDEDLQNLKKEEEWILNRHMRHNLNKRKEKEDISIFGPALTFLLTATTCGIIYLLFTTPWFSSPTNSAS
jgi:hypothetical protein